MKALLSLLFHVAAAQFYSFNIDLLQSGCKYTQAIGMSYIVTTPNTWLNQTNIPPSEVVLGSNPLLHGRATSFTIYRSWMCDNTIRSFAAFFQTTESSELALSLQFSDDSSDGYWACNNSPLACDKGCTLTCSTYTVYPLLRPPAASLSSSKDRVCSLFLRSIGLP